MICCVCKTKLLDHGHNPAPLKYGKLDRCCAKCNADIVLPLRILEVRNNLSRYEIRVMKEKVEKLQHEIKESTAALKLLTIDTSCSKEID